MATRSFFRAVMAAVLCLTSLGPDLLRAEDAELATGIRQAQQGEFDAAVVTLDRVAQRMAAARAPGRELARAYVYLAVAQLGLGQEAKASQSFVNARTQDPDLRLDAAEFPPKIVQAYEQALQSAGLALPAPAPAAPAPAAQPAKKGGGSKALWVVAGLGAAGAGVAVAAGGGGGGGDSGPAATTPPPPTIPDISGRWTGDGSNGEFLVSGACSLQNSVILNITQSAGTITGTADFVVLRAPCDPTTVGIRDSLQLTGTVDAQGQVSFRFTNGRIPTEQWRGTLDSSRTRMNGDITGIPGITSGSWTVLR